jgi:hypothetical protein
MILLALGLVALVPPQGAPGAGGSVWDRLTFEAEGRMRGEATLENVDASDFDGNGTPAGEEIDDRYRGRLRFRLGAKYPLTEELGLAARLSTSSDGNDANNPHWDFGDGDGFNGSNLVLDRFYLDWMAHEDVHVVVGKQPHAFATPPIYGDFLWDSDVSPAGVSGSWRPASDRREVTFDARAAAYVATELAADDDDPEMYGAQGNVYLPIDDWKLQVSSAIYHWEDAGIVGGDQGNSATDDFLVWESFAAATIPGGPMDEMTGYVQVMHNLQESDNGAAVGAQLGSSKWERGNWNAFLILYALDGDAVFSPVAQDDTPIAGTGLNDGGGDGMTGGIVGATYYWQDNIALKLWVLTSHPEGADDDPIRLRLDLDFKLK